MTTLLEKQKNMALVDALTGINNRRYFDERLPTEISRSQRYNKPLSCLYIGVDHFKQFNNDYGHINGNKALKQIAQKIWQELRATDILGRYSEEEFAVLLIETDMISAREVAERIRRSIQKQQVEIEGRTIEITVSVGVSSSQPCREQINCPGL